ncbi:hypothetical protein P8C59_000494 [Phyllachora maydis]|uniref:Uncharacterized protein n=1 Tax=Phyllachora maydis TaxID=1825666 RepID=A0AAD9HW99_9PEZI|nr:hypothetical protein P8C59_000494 [Phyllachora maydis]
MPSTPRNSHATRSPGLSLSPSPSTATRSSDYATLPAWERLNPYSGEAAAAAARLRQLARAHAGPGRRAAVLADVCHQGTSRLARLRFENKAAWAVEREEQARFGRDFLRRRAAAAAELPHHRLVMTSLLGALAPDHHADGVGRACPVVAAAAARWLAAPRDAGWTVEDYYVRYILRVLVALYDGRGAPLVWWLNHPDLVSLADQIWIGFCTLLLFQLDEQVRARGRMSFWRRSSRCWFG